MVVRKQANRRFHRHVDVVARSFILLVTVTSLEIDDRSFSRCLVFARND